MEDSEFEQELGTWSEEISGLAAGFTQLETEVDTLRQRAAEGDLRFQDHLNKARTEMDGEILQLTASIVQLDEEQRKRIEYYEEKIALLVGQVNQADIILSKRGVTPLLEADRYGGESRRKPEQVQFVTGTTSLVSSHLLRSYQPPVPVDVIGQTWSGDPVPVPSLQRASEERGNGHEPKRTAEKRPVGENEVVINGQIGRKGDLHEWAV